MSLKICDITMFYPTTNAGGVKSYLLAKKAYCLKHTPHQHALIVPSDMSAKTPLGERDLLFEVASPPLPWNRSYRFLCSYRGIQKALEAFQPDIVEVGCPYAVPWLVRAAIRKLRRRPKLLGFYHADFQNDLFRVFQGVSPWAAKGLRRIAEIYARFLYQRLDYCLVAAPLVGEKLNSLGINNVKVFPFGTDPEIFRPINSPASEDSTIHLLYAGRIASDKGVLPFIDLMHRLVRDGTKVDLTLVGSGFQKEAAVRRAKKVSYIRFLPFIHNKEELAKVYSSHDLLVVPSPFETFCLSALESMACGTPVAALNGHGGIETIVNEETGFLLGEDMQAFFPFLKQISRMKLLSMRPTARAFAVRHFKQIDCFNNLFRFYEELYGTKIAHRLHS